MKEDQKNNIDINIYYLEIHSDVKNWTDGWYSYDYYDVKSYHKDGTFYKQGKTRVSTLDETSRPANEDEIAKFKLLQL